jgi:hypothetical protein
MAWLSEVFSYVHKLLCGPGSSVGIATGYRLDSPGIKSRWGWDFSHTSRPALGPTQPPVQWVPGLPGGKTAGALCWPPTPTKRRGWEWIELYLYSPSRPLVACYRVTFTFFYISYYNIIPCHLRLLKLVIPVFIPAWTVADLLNLWRVLNLTLIAPFQVKSDIVISHWTLCQAALM